MDVIIYFKKLLYRHFWGTALHQVLPFLDKQIFKGLLMYMIIKANEKQAAEKEKSTEQKVQEQQSKDSEKVIFLK